jgi:replicative DNA helicase
MQKNNKGKTTPRNTGKSPEGEMYSEEAEKAVIGALMANVETLGQVIDDERIRVEDLFIPACQVTFRTVMEMDKQLMPVNLMTLAQHLIDIGLIGEVGGPGFLAECLNLFPGKYMVSTVCRTVKNKSDIRKLLNVGTDIRKYTVDHLEDPKAAIDFAQKRVGELEWSGEEKTSNDIKVINEQAFDYIEKITNNKVSQTGIPYGFDRLDELTGGCSHPDMTVLAARPGIGKTALALTFMRYMASIGRVPGFWSLEMTSKQLQMRNLAAVAKVPHLAMRRGLLKEEELERVRHAKEEMSRWDARIDDWSGHTIHSISAKARKWKREFGMDVIFIDYLQLINPDDSNQWNRADQVSTISRGIKGLAKQLEVPVVVLAQLSRAAEDGEEPRLSQLRESGAIEQDADNVFFLWKNEDQKVKSTGGKRIINYNLSIAKQRSGPTDKIALKYYEWMTLFEEVPQEKKEEE